jgi:hypothetical protein
VDSLQDGSKAGELELLLLEPHHAWQTKAECIKLLSARRARLSRHDKE